MASVWLAHKGYCFRYSPIASFIPKPYSKELSRGYLYKCHRHVVGATRITDENGKQLCCISDSGHKIDRIISSRVKKVEVDSVRNATSYICSRYYTHPPEDILSQNQKLGLQSYLFSDPVVLRTGPEVVLGEMSEVLEWNKEQLERDFRFIPVALGLGLSCLFSFTILNAEGVEYPKTWWSGY